MARIFDFDGPNLNKGFINLRAAEHPEEKRLHEIIEGMWERYEPYADADFRDGFARDVDARFWEMYLGWTFLEAGLALLPTSERLREGGQPDLCILTDNGRIWIEAIAPDEGDAGPDQVKRPVLLIAAENCPSGGADKNLDWFYVTMPRQFRYSIGLRAPSDILIRFSLYHRM
ncbi:hypothetical protein [Brucella pituitosa]|uniref:hypothetical protein n=1 Tax=Brucella pituitosa TaxID=571256 RepID=UPI001876F676|nr:hypothetical protein [Brucella pituitosa]